jgi:putative transposase
MNNYRPFYRRHLPHWQPPGATLFVTFRLAGSLPQAMIDELQAADRQRETVLSRIEDRAERQKQANLEARRSFGRWDIALDEAQSGRRWLAIPAVANVVAEALHYRDGRVYDLMAFCIMPNHVHLVCTPLPGEDGKCHPLQRILQSLKRHTARQANRILGRQGAFWQAESYDHVVRDERELARVVDYVIDNPVKAGLTSDGLSWPWTYVVGRIANPTYEKTGSAVAGRIDNPPYEEMR